MTADTYLNLCTQVYDLSKSTAPEDAYDLYRSYAAQANGLILEPMCGTGQFLLPLVAEGFDVHGFDGSGHMLDALQKKAKNQNIEVNVWQGLISEQNTQTKYKLIFIPRCSFGLITNEKDAINALKMFYAFLEKDGKLVFETETLKAGPAQPNVWRGSAYPTEDGKLILANFLDLPPENNVGSTICRYELVDANTIIKTEIENIRVRLYEPASLEYLLKEIGFKDVKMIKAFSLNMKPDLDDEVIIYECKK